jgi:zinc protease
MDRVTPPLFKKSLLFTLPNPERITLNQGAEIIYLPSSLSQAVKIEFVFQAGKIHEPALGVAQFTTQLLDKGVLGKKANDIANALDYYGAHLESNAGFDFVSVSLYCLKKDVKHLLPLFIQLLTEATFPEDELETYRNIFIENLKVNLEKNSFLASNEIRKTLLGSHPYGLSVSEKNAAEINIDHLKSYFKDFYRPHKIFIVGDIETDDLKRLSDYSYKPQGRNIPGKLTETNKSARSDVKGPNHTQASVRLGQITIDRKHPDTAGLALINHILGGFFGSRLMKNIREEKGLTYGIHSGIQHLVNTSWLTISADVNAEKVDEAIYEIQKELAALSNFNDLEELTLSKNHLTGSFQNDNSTIFSIADRIKNISLNNLDQNYYQDLINSIDLQKLSDIQALSSRYLNPETFSIVVVK